MIYFLVIPKMKRLIAFFKFFSNTVPTLVRHIQKVDTKHHFIQREYRKDAFSVQDS